MRRRACYIERMFDWIGSLRVRERTETRVVLRLSLTTQLLGWAILVPALYGIWLVWPVSRWLSVGPLVVAGLALLLATTRRELIFDREAGVLRVDQRVLGLPTRVVVPLFHLRAVVVEARATVAHDGVGRVLLSPRYVAYVERRVGEAIYLDEARRCARLLTMAEAIAEVAELRLEYDAMSRASG